VCMLICVCLCVYVRALRVTVYECVTARVFIRLFLQILIHYYSTRITLFPETPYAAPSVFGSARRTGRPTPRTMSFSFARVASDPKTSNTSRPTSPISPPPTSPPPFVPGPTPDPTADPICAPFLLCGSLPPGAPPQTTPDPKWVPFPPGGVPPPPPPISPSSCMQDTMITIQKWSRRQV